MKSEPRFRAHGLLEAAKVVCFPWNNGLVQLPENLWHFPSPVLAVAVGESEVAALQVPIGWQIPPGLRQAPSRNKNTKQRIENLVSMDVAESEQPGRAGISDLRLFLETGREENIGRHIRYAVDGL